MRAKGIRISQGSAESCRKRLTELQILDRHLRPSREGRIVVFPVTAYPPADFDGERCEADFKESRPRRSYREVARVPDELRSHIPSSFDTIGKKALVKLPESLSHYGREVGEAILKTHPSLDAVFEDGGVEGEFRTRKVARLAGEGTTETVVTEFGIRLRLDVSKTFYSPRLATERRLVCSSIRPGELILDMFAGVGPFSIHAARRATAGHVVSLDINPYAVSYLKENAALNSISNIEAHLVDASAYTGGPFDRIIMNLPTGGRSFVGHALSLLSHEGTVEYYELMENDLLQNRIEEMQESGGQVLDSRKVKSYSPSQGIYHLTLSGKRS